MSAPYFPVKFYSISGFSGIDGLSFFLLLEAFHSSFSSLTTHQNTIFDWYYTVSLLVHILQVLKNWHSSKYLELQGWVQIQSKIRFDTWIFTISLGAHSWKLFTNESWVLYIVQTNVEYPWRVWEWNPNTTELLLRWLNDWKLFLLLCGLIFSWGAV